MADESTNTIRVIVCRPDERAEIVEIETIKYDPDGKNPVTAFNARGDAMRDYAR